MIKAPATQVKEAIVEHLRGLCEQFSMPITTDSIRGILDLTGQPRDAFGVVVAVEDQGDWSGNTNRILVRLAPQINVFTHLDDDQDGSLAEALANDVLNAVRSIEYSLEGWIVCWNGNWAITDSGMDGSYRQIVLTAVLPLNRVS